MNAKTQIQAVPENHSPAAHHGRWSRRSWSDPVLFQAMMRPAKVAVRDLTTDRSVSFSELNDMIGVIGKILAAHTSSTGKDRVALIGRNSLEQLVIYMACQRSGNIYIPLNWRLSEHELQAIITDAQPAVVILATEFASFGPWVTDVYPETVCLPMDLFSTAIADHGGRNEEMQVRAHEDSACIHLYTSGTSGDPKAVIITGEQAFNACTNFAMVGDVDAASVLLCDLPLFHTMGLVTVARTALHVGATLLINDRFDPAQTLDRLADDAMGITHYFGVPQMAAALSREPGFQAKSLSHLRAFFTGGAPIPPSLIDTYLAAGILLVNGYGMSETGAIMHMPLNAELIKANPGAVGVPSPLMDVRLVDPATGKDVADGESGEIWVRGPSVCTGYWGRASTIEGLVDGGWFRTGDIGRKIDRYFYLVDRLKDIFISGGENVSPSEVEAALMFAPGVRDVAVIGVPDPRWGEVGIAFIEADPDANTAEMEIELKACCRARLGRFKHPMAYLFLEKIPRTAAGKIRRGDLHSMALANHAAPGQSHSKEL